MSLAARGLAQAYARGRQQVRAFNAAAACRPHSPSPISHSQSPEHEPPTTNNEPVCSSPSPSSSASAAPRSSSASSSSARGTSTDRRCPCGCGELLADGQLVCPALLHDVDPYWRRAVRSKNLVECLVANRHMLAVAAKLRRVRGKAAAALPPTTPEAL